MTLQMESREDLENKMAEIKKKISNLNSEEKALILADNNHVDVVSPKTALVKSETTKSTYTVDYVARTCDCPHHKYRNAFCKHIQAALIQVKRTPFVDPCKVSQNDAQQYNSFDEYASVLASVHPQKIKMPSSYIDNMAREDTQGLINKDLLLD